MSVLKSVLFCLLVLYISHLAFADTCSTSKSCVSCAGRYEPVSRSYCQWCPITGTCSSTRLPTPPGCGVPLARSTQCPVSAPAKPCPTASSCSSCIAMQYCGWCADSNACHSGTRSGSSLSACHDWRWASCNPSYRSVRWVWVLIGLGVLITVLSAALAVCLRKARAAQQSQAVGYEMVETESNNTSFDYSAPVPNSNPVMTNVVPGYMYTTQAAGNQPQYLYTAVPVGMPIMTIPTQSNQ